MTATPAIHQPCPDCGSSDALQINTDYTYCHACTKTTQLRPGDVIWTKKPIQEGVTQAMQSGSPSGLSLSRFKELQEKSKGNPKGVPERALSGSTMLRYGVVKQGDEVIFPYYDADGNLVAAKIRTKDKKFPTIGTIQKAVLFGQQLWSGGGRYITITEGEFDAMAAFQMHGSKYPVVSLKNGASAALKECKQNYEFLDTYDHIVIDFDSDEPGRKAAKEVAELFGGKSLIMKHREGYKDACDYSSNGKTAQYIEDFWKADKFVPDGIVAGSDLWEQVNNPVAKAELMYPFEGVNKMTYGIRLGEMVMLCAGSGVGKSQFTREIVYKALLDTDYNVGMLMLEESNRKTGLGLMSVAANKPLHLPTTQSTEEERREAFDATLGTGRVYMFNHFGSNSIDNIVNRVRYMAKGLDCKLVVLDHISIVVSDQENLDERKALDEITTKLRTLVEETGIALICVTHLKRPEGKGHEEGAQTSLSQLRGSAAIGQLSDIVIGLERNCQADDIEERNTTVPRVLKNRFSGEQGRAYPVVYNQTTGRLKEVSQVDMEEAL